MVKIARICPKIYPFLQLVMLIMPYLHCADFVLTINVGCTQSYHVASVISYKLQQPRGIMLSHFARMVL